MNRKEAILNLILSLIGLMGAFLGGYWGGLITGASLALIFLVTVGKLLAKKEIKRINTIIRNHQRHD